MIHFLVGVKPYLFQVCPLGIRFVFFATVLSGLGCLFDFVLMVVLRSAATSSLGFLFVGVFALSFLPHITDKAKGMQRQL